MKESQFFLLIGFIATIPLMQEETATLSAIFFLGIGFVLSLWESYLEYKKYKGD